MLYVTTAAQVKSVFLGLTPSKFLQEQTKFLLPSYASYDQTSLYRQKLGHGWSEKKKTYFRVYWVIKHILHITYYIPSIQYISFFHSFLKGRSPISDDIFHIIPFHCYLYYSHDSSMKHQEMRGEGKLKL